MSFKIFHIWEKGDIMGLGYETNFYIRKDSPNILWSGLSVSIPDEEYNNYKLSCYITKKNGDIWKARESDLIIFDNKNNMYKVALYDISQIYNTNARDTEVSYPVEVSSPEDKYSDVETKTIHLNELFIKNIIDELKIKTEHSFGVKITI